MEKETFERIEKTQEDINSALVELLMLVQELKQKIEILEEWYERRNKGRTEE